MAARTRTRAGKAPSRNSTATPGAPAPAPRKLHPNRRVFSPDLMADGKRRYETTPESLDGIALDFGVVRTTLRRIADENGWVRFVRPPRSLSRAAQIAAKAEALLEETQDARDASTKAPPTPDPSPPFEARMGGGDELAAPPAAPSKTWSTRERIEELRAAVDDELIAVRALRAQLKRVPHSNETANRISRTLADLTTTLDRLHRLEIGAPQHDGPDAYDDDMPADIDAFRLDLARRIRAFVESRSDPGGDVRDDESPPDDAVRP